MVIIMESAQLMTQPCPICQNEIGNTECSICMGAGEIIVPQMDNELINPMNRMMSLDVNSLD